jgi:tetratricopeptide (TPR) repeat protein
VQAFASKHLLWQCQIKGQGGPFERGGQMEKKYAYKAFISYSHADEKWGRWLHRRLETYRIPRRLIGTVETGGTIPKRLRPIFRDREDLAAAENLGEKIEQALAASENLIVICSPAAANSHWVGQEILSFKRQNKGAQIFCLIIEGEPFSSSAPTAECFPKALRFDLGEDGELSDMPAEPLAADIRAHADGKRLGVLKLVSGMIGVGLDDLVQRDLQRSRRRVTAITAMAATAVIVMAGLTGFALNARKDAEARRGDAEGLIEFMLTDLKDTLEPVGRLDALQSVGMKAAEYYGKYPLAVHDANALGRRARVFHYLGDIQDKLGNLDEADQYFQKAYAATQDLLARDPNNPDRIFEHAQSAYYVGYLLWKAGKYDAAHPYFDEYITRAEQLKTAEPDSLRAQQELTYAYTNLGILLYKQGQVEKAYALYQQALPAYIKIAEENPDIVQYQLDLANAYGWLADASEENQNTKIAFNYRLKQTYIFEPILAKNKKDLKVQSLNLAAILALGYLALETNKISYAIELSAKATTDSKFLYDNDPSNIVFLKSYGLILLLSAEVLFQDEQYDQSRLQISRLEGLISSQPQSPVGTKQVLDFISQKKTQLTNKLNP